MAKLSEFFNTVSNDNRIFTAEDVGEMSLEEFRRNEKAIFHQMANLGVPRIDENGYFHGILFDKYDFSSDYDYISNPFLATANNYFYLLQKTLDRNFYVLTPITFKW